MPARHTAPTLQQVLSRAHRSLVLFAVLLAGATLLLSGAVMMRDYVTRNLQLIARTVSYTVEPAIVFGDRDAIREGMDSVVGQGMVERIEVVDLKGKVLASWQREGSGIGFEIEQWGSRLLWPKPVVETVGMDGVPIARVRMLGSAAGISRFLQSGLVVALCCLGIALIATNILARRLQTGVIMPLQHVAEVARSVRVERAFHRRVPAPGLADVDNFVQDFNALLSELQGWYTGIEQENQELARQAMHDALTGLGNRMAFERKLDSVIAHGGPDRPHFAVLYLDANRFKQINDSYGHDAGDAVLQAIAARLGQCIRTVDKAFRLGGDEFAIILAPPTNAAEVETVIERIVEGMRPPIMLPDGGVVTMTLSIGFSVYPEDGVASDELVRKADKAMYRDKLRRSDDGVVYPQ